MKEKKKLILREVLRARKAFYSPLDFLSQAHNPLFPFALVISNTYFCAGCIDDILKFVTLLGHPDTDMGRVGYCGGCISAPILIHVTVQKPAATPIHTP